MKLIVVLFIMALTPVAFSQNEWWRIGKKSETESKTKEENKKVEVKEEEEAPTIAEEEVWVSDSIVEPERFKPGRINVVKNPSIDKIIKFKSATIPPNMGPLMNGYRIQLFFDQSRSAVDKARSEMLKLDDRSTTYIKYKAPNYFLMQGDYRSQLEAEKVRAELISEFPAALVVEDKIYLPEIKEDENSDEKEK